MSKKLSARELARLESKRDVWQEVLEGAKEIKAGRGKRTSVQPRSPVVRVRLKTGLTQAQFAVLLGVSVRTLEQWEQGRRSPSGAAKTLIQVAEKHPEVLREIAA
jgi:putative transcriptional regulator